PADQVDRHFLTTAPLPFFYVRQAVRNIVYWARLRGSPHQPKGGWPEVDRRANPPSRLRRPLAYFPRPRPPHRRAEARGARRRRRRLREFPDAGAPGPMDEAPTAAMPKPPPPAPS